MNKKVTSLRGANAPKQPRVLQYQDLSGLLRQSYALPRNDDRGKSGQ